MSCQWLSERQQCALFLLPNGIQSTIYPAHSTPGVHIHTESDFFSSFLRREIPGTFGFEVMRSQAFFLFFIIAHFYFPASGQAVVTGANPSPPRFLPSIFIAHRVQQSHCSSIFHRTLLTHALALSASQFICPQEKVPTNLYEYALGGARTHETDLYQARG